MPGRADPEGSPPEAEARHPAAFACAGRRCCAALGPFACRLRKRAGPGAHCAARSNDCHERSCFPHLDSQCMCAGEQLRREDLQLSCGHNSMRDSDAEPLAMTNSVCGGKFSSHQLGNACMLAAHDCMDLSACRCCVFLLDKSTGAGHRLCAFASRPSSSSHTRMLGQGQENRSMRARHMCAWTHACRACLHACACAHAEAHLCRSLLEW